ncbi:10502_t:CDS:1, partial [Dentiscutata heterogama]
EEEGVRVVAHHLVRIVAVQALVQVLTHHHYGSFGIMITTELENVEITA